MLKQNLPREEVQTKPISGYSHYVVQEVERGFLQFVQHKPHACDRGHELHFHRLRQCSGRGFQMQQRLVCVLFRD